MELEEYLDADFAIYFADDNPDLLLSTTNVIKSHSGFVDKKNPPKEKTLQMGKKKFAQAFKVYADALGYKELMKHPSRFCKDVGLDMYRGEELTPASSLLRQWLEMPDAH